MGPRPDGRGRFGAGGRAPERRKASMGPRPDGRGRSLGPRRPCGAIRVNGAAAGWPRKAPASRTKKWPWMRQWGRGRMAAEGGDAAVEADLYALASMGPRPDGRGRPRSGSPPCASLAMRQWGRGRMAAEGASLRPLQGGADRASMGPRPDGRGRLRPDRIEPAVADQRQWGRGRMAAEGGVALFAPAPRQAASMGPRPDGRGRAVRQVAKHAQVDASMGPRPDGRGRTSGRKTPATPPCVNGAAAGWPRKACARLMAL